MGFTGFPKTKKDEEGGLQQFGGKAGKPPITAGFSCGAHFVTGGCEIRIFC